MCLRWPQGRTMAPHLPLCSLLVQNPGSYFKGWHCHMGNQWSNRWPGQTSMTGHDSSTEIPGQPKRVSESFPGNWGSYKSSSNWLFWLYHLAGNIFAHGSTLDCHHPWVCLSPTPVFFCTGNWTQDLALARQALYHWAIYPQQDFFLNLHEVFLIQLEVLEKQELGLQWRYLN